MKLSANILAMEKADSHICQRQGKTSLWGFREQLQYAWHAVRKFKIAGLILDLDTVFPKPMLVMPVFQLLCSLLLLQVVKQMVPERAVPNYLLLYRSWIPPRNDLICNREYKAHVIAFLSPTLLVNKEQTVSLAEMSNWCMKLAFLWMNGSFSMTAIKELFS